MKPHAKKAMRALVFAYCIGSYVYSIFFNWHLSSDGTGGWGSLTGVLIFLVSPWYLVLHLVLVITGNLGYPWGGRSWNATNTFSAIGFVGAFVVSYILVRKVQERGTRSQRNSGNSPH